MAICYELFERDTFFSVNTSVMAVVGASDIEQNDADNGPRQ